MGIPASPKYTSDVGGGGEGGGSYSSPNDKLDVWRFSLSKNIIINRAGCSPPTHTLQLRGFNLSIPFHSVTLFLSHNSIFNLSIPFHSVTLYLSHNSIFNLSIPFHSVTLYLSHDSIFNLSIPFHSVTLYLSHNSMLFQSSHSITLIVIRMVLA